MSPSITDRLLDWTEDIFDNAGVIALGWILFHEAEAAGLPWWGFYFAVLLVAVFGIPLWMVSNGFRDEADETTEPY